MVEALSTADEASWKKSPYRTSDQAMCWCRFDSARRCADHRFDPALPLSALYPPGRTMTSSGSKRRSPGSISLDFMPFRSFRTLLFGAYC